MANQLIGKLFAIGQGVGSPGNVQFQGNPQRGGFQNRAPDVPTPTPEQQGSGGWGALAGVAGTLGSSLFQNTQGAAPVDPTGKGFGIGGESVQGDVGGATYAGSSDVSPLAQLFKKDNKPFMKDNETTTPNSPFALNYANAPQPPGLLMHY